MNAATRLVGRTLPDAVGRTDEGTPVSLADFSGRALAVFLCGNGIDETKTALFQRVKEQERAFLALDCSPVVISCEAEEVLAAARAVDDLPFMLISDFSSHMHKELQADPASSRCFALLADADGMVAAVVPPLEAGALVARALTEAKRLLRPEGR